MESQIALLKARLRAQTGCRDEDIRIVRSPLRVSPLGAHVDHQDGLVTGVALDRAVYLAFVPRDDGWVRVESLNFPGRLEFGLDRVPPKSPSDWGNYARGAAVALQQSYDLRVGIDAVVMGSMPIGGLSSSAAVGVAYLLALEAVNDLALSAEENIKLDRYIENVYLGLKNGVLDQSIILLSDRDCLTYLDCQSMEVKRIGTAAPQDAFEILVVYSGVKQALVGTDYNNRVNECYEAARLMLEWSGTPHPNGNSRLRLVPPEVYAELRDRLPAPLDRRARHFFTELARVQAGVEAWRAGDIGRLGELMRESGASSVYNYESGCPHLTTLYEILSECPGVYGARFSGGGFRGACIGLSDPDRREEIIAFIAERYPAAHPDIAGLFSVHFCQTGEAARLLA
ncbi:MAG: GHMP kinase [Anaerolineae bacterium]|nr:GHMP kinase [Anaerolineae bacterium]